VSQQPMSIPTLGGRIRSRRQAARMSLRELAGRAGLTAGFLCDIEHDRRGISVNNAIRIASALDVSPAWLMGESPDRRRVQLGVIEFHSSRLNPGLIERFYAVTKDLRDAACIVDLWLLDIAAVLNEFGYDMEIYKRPARGPDGPRASDTGSAEAGAGAESAGEE
jgi:transcriptional regulator with XRE-family HTH domain